MTRPVRLRLSDLIAVYRSDEDSPYRAVRQNTRVGYDYCLGILEREIGSARIDVLTRKDFAAWHRRFSEGGRVRRAHGLMTMLRMLLSFGASMRFDGCRDAKDVLGEMTFSTPPRRTTAMTYPQAHAIVEKAIGLGVRSIALGQALQFELGLRQADVIGQWTVNHGTGGIRWKGRTWGGGLTWTDLTADSLAKRTSKTGAEGQWNPAEFPLLVRAMGAFTPPERIGPAIVDERAGRPYSSRHAYGEVWRRVADAAGVPRTVWNMDSRAGAISEAADAGASMEDMREFATHANAATTSRYVRRSLEATTRVARRRVALRNGGSL